MQVLAIETSCDETAVAIINESKKVFFHQIWSQDHSSYGGVIPEIASRNHLTTLKIMMNAALETADFTHIAVTGGPGLIGGVMVGLMTAKAIASITKKPFIAINHLEGHILSARFSNDIEFPCLVLLISGGHCQIICAEDIGKYKVIGKTLDDALGETFDKVAKMLNLSYPGGPQIEKLACNGDENKFDLPLPMYKRAGCDFSFSGLKTAVKQLIAKYAPLSLQDKRDLCASFQRVICTIIIDRISNALKIFKQNYNGKHFIIVGGVATNLYIRQKIKAYIENHNMMFCVPPANLCTDNAIMIGWTAIEHFMNGMNGTDLNFAPLARWSVENIKMHL